MENIEENIKIAEFCGAKWHNVKHLGTDINVLTFKINVTYQDLGTQRWEFCDGNKILASDIPRYNENLNAMLNPEDIAYNKMPAGWSYKYTKFLAEYSMKSKNDLEYNWLWHITPQIKAKAFIKSIQ